MACQECPCEGNYRSELHPPLQLREIMCQWTVSIPDKFLSIAGFEPGVFKANDVVSDLDAYIAAVEIEVDLNNW